ncbi:MAG: MipA/OmpV family protein [Fusobacterium necrophorum]|nr:MipA/OmpV family protein [Fusobacterium necrophorum]
MKKTLVILGFLSFNILTYSQEKTTSLSIGVSGSYSKDIYKSKEKEKPSFLPVIFINYKGLYLNLSEMGYNFPISNNITLSAYSNFSDGYPIKRKDLEDGFQTLKNRKSQVVGGGRISYSTDIFQSSLFLQGGKRGNSSGVEMSLNFPLTDKLSFVTGVNYTMYSKKFTNYYFGVSKEEIGGELKSTYSPKASSSYGAEISFEYQITDPLLLTVTLSATNYSKQIKNSPFVKDRINSSTTVGLQYLF